MSEADERGFVVVTGRGAVRWASRRARALLAERGLFLGRGALLPATLITWLQPVIAGRAATVPWFHRRSRQRTLTITYHPDDGSNTGAMLCLREHAAPAAQSDAAARPPAARRALANAFGLTPRESEVALWISRGKSNQEISIILGIRPATVKKHAARIFVKLGVENRTSVASNVCAVVGAQSDAETDPLP